MTWSSRIQEIINKDFPPHTHPSRIFERTLLEQVKPGSTVLDIGCGRRAPNLMKLRGTAETLIGIDVVDFEVSEPKLILSNCSVSNMNRIATGSIDIAYSRSVMEHVDNVDAAYSEIHRVLRPGGKYLFLTPNFWDYVSLISCVIPNRLHGKLVKFAEGRPESETFPVYYRSNTHYRINKLSRKHKLKVVDFKYFGQYPSALLFSDALFRAGSTYEKLLERYRYLHFLRRWILCILSKTE